MPNTINNNAFLVNTGYYHNIDFLYMPFVQNTKLRPGTAHKRLVEEGYYDADFQEGMAFNERPAFTEEQIRASKNKKVLMGMNDIAFTDLPLYYKKDNLTVRKCVLLLLHAVCKFGSKRHRAALAAILAKQPDLTEAVTNDNHIYWQCQFTSLLREVFNILEKMSPKGYTFSTYTQAYCVHDEEEQVSDDLPKVGWHIKNA